MLELQKKQIHMSRSKNTVSAQVTFDEDFNIPDAKPDVGSVLLKQADAVMEELRQLSEKVIIKGRLDFEILYAVEGSGRMKNLSGALTFEENVSYPGLEPGRLCALPHKGGRYQYSCCQLKKASYQCRAWRGTFCCISTA